LRLKLKSVFAPGSNAATLVSYETVCDTWNSGVWLSKSYDRKRALSMRCCSARVLNVKADAVTRALASADVRSIGTAGSAPLIVNGIRGWSCDQSPSDTYAVATLVIGSLTRPLTDPELSLLFGHSASRPCAGPDPVPESVIRSGLSQTIR